MKDCSARVSPPRVPGLISLSVLVFFAFLDSLHLDFVSASSTVCYTIEFGQLGEIAVVTILLWCFTKAGSRFPPPSEFSRTQTRFCCRVLIGVYLAFCGHEVFLPMALCIRCYGSSHWSATETFICTWCYLRSPWLTMHRCLFRRSEGTIFQSASLRIYTPRDWKNASTTCTVGYFWTRAISRILPRK